MGGGVPRLGPPPAGRAARSQCKSSSTRRRRTVAPSVRPAPRPRRRPASARRAHPTAMGSEDGDRRDSPMRCAAPAWCHRPCPAPHSPLAGPRPPCRASRHPQHPDRHAAGRKGAGAPAPAGGAAAAAGAPAASARRPAPAAVRLPCCCRHPAASLQLPPHASGRPAGHHTARARAAHCCPRLRLQPRHPRPETPACGCGPPRPATATCVLDRLRPAQPTRAAASRGLPGHLRAAASRGLPGHLRALPGRGPLLPASRRPGCCGVSAGSARGTQVWPARAVLQTCRATDGAAPPAGNLSCGGTLSR